MCVCVIICILFVVTNCYLVYVWMACLGSIQAIMLLSTHKMINITSNEVHIYTIEGCMYGTRNFNVRTSAYKLAVSYSGQS